MSAWAEMAGPLWLSVRVALCATALAALVALPLAALTARPRRRHQARVGVARGAAELLMLLPLVLPPTVVGYALIMLLGARGPIAPLLGGYSIVFRFEGAVLASTVVALPLLYLPARAALAEVDGELIDLARLLGASRWRTFWSVLLPLARRGVGGGLVLAFARALGEFGATVMVFGWRNDGATLPVVIYAAYDQGEPERALPAALALVALSVALLAAYGWTTRRS